MTTKTRSKSESFRAKTSDESTEPSPTAPAPAAGYTVAEVALSQIVAGRNARKWFDPVALQDLADDIAERGVDQAISIRERDPANIVPHMVRAGQGDTYEVVRAGIVDSVVATFPGQAAARELADRLSTAPYELIAGERRYRASVIAGHETIPARIRTLDDSESLVAGLLENLMRSDLNAVETSEGIRDLIEETQMTQAEAAAKLRRTPSDLSNALRLLKLPPTVLEHIRAGELTRSHGLAILRFGQFPDIITAIAAKAIEEGTPAKALEQGLPFADYLHGRLRQFAYDKKDGFPECSTCPFGAFVKSSYRSFCLKPSHFDQLLAEQVKAATTSIDRKATSVAVALATVYEADPTISRKKALAEVAKKGVLPRVDTLAYRSFERIGKAPTGCTEDCKCRSAAAAGKDGKPIQICTNPSRYSSLQQADEKKRKDALKAQAVGLTAQLTAVAATLTDSAAPSTLGIRALALTIGEAMRARGTMTVGKAAEGLIESGTFASLLSDYDAAKRLKGAQALALCSVGEMVRFAMVAIGLTEIDQACTAYQPTGKTPRLDWLLEGAKLDAEREAILADVPAALAETEFARGASDDEGVDDRLRIYERDDDPEPPLDVCLVDAQEIRQLCAAWSGALITSGRKLPTVQAHPRGYGTLFCPVEINYRQPGSVPVSVHARLLVKVEGFSPAQSVPFRAGDGYAGVHVMFEERVYELGDGVLFSVEEA